MDLVDEQDVARLERGQDRRHVALSLERRSCDAADADVELLADDVGETRLAQAGRADEQHVVERLRPRPRGLERDLELLLDPVLSDEVVEPSGPQRALELVLLGLRAGARNWSVTPPSAPAAHALRAELRVGRGERAFRLGARAELDERVPRDQVGRAPGTACSSPIFSFSSSTTR